MDVPPGDRIRFRALLLAAIAGAVATRGVLLWKFRGALIDSDEAVMGLMATNVLHGHIPIFFYGQSYMGSLEAFLAAAWFAISSATPFVLKLSTLTWFAAFLAAQPLLMRQVTDRATASMNTLLLAVSPAFLTVMSLKAWGYMSLLL